MSEEPESYKAGLRDPVHDVTNFADWDVRG
jgi:hypothetical protein